jgi:hypothetical protein
MINAGYLWDEISAALRLFGADDILSIKKSTNMSYFHLCSLRSWVDLRKRTTIDFSSHDSNNSVNLPGDLAGVDAVWDSADHYQFNLCDRWQAEHSDENDEDLNYRWFYTDAEVDSLAILTGVSLNQGGNTFTCDNWSDSYIGEYITIGNELGVYKLTAANTFTPRWYGPKLTGAPNEDIQVRPAGTKRFSIVDYNGDFMSGTTVHLYYWRKPTPLYLASQPILLPDYKPLELLTIINVLGLKDRKENVADNYRIQYDKAFALMDAMNPAFESPFMPLNRDGDLRSFTGN